MNAAPAVAASSMIAAPGKYLTVTLAGEAYGIDVLKVREIIRLQKITPVPNLPDYVRGVINLRGRVLPIIDLRVKFGVPAASTAQTCIIVVQIALAAGQLVQMGLTVDAVQDVTHLSAGEIEPTPDFGIHLDHACLLGVARTKDQVKLLLHLEHVVSPAVFENLPPHSGSK